jgi:ABC-type transport system involved in multi-copper enzyme maturation permease subunit
MKSFSISTIIARNELVLLFRERTLYILLSIFFVMAVLSTIIGWSTQHTIANVYDAAVAELAVVGQNAPSFPVNSTPLSIMTNMIIYNALIGTLLALVLGYFIGIHDRTYGVVKLLFSRPVKPWHIFLGKVSAGVTVLLIINAITWLVSITSLFVFGIFSQSALLSVVLFYGLSFLYMSGFLFLAMAFAFVFENATSAMLYALYIWMIITFALPELSSALFPTSSLNPILPPSNIVNSPILALVHSISYPFSVSEHYKALSSSILGVSTNVAGASSVTYDLLVVTLWCVLTGTLASQFFKLVKLSNESIYE